MTSYKDKCYAIIEAFGRMTTNEFIHFYNAYLDENHYQEDKIYFLEDIDEILGDIKPSEVLQLFANGIYNSSDDYFRFDGYGNIVTMDEFDVLDHIDVNNITEYLLEYQPINLLSECDDIYELFEEWWDEDDETDEVEVVE